MAICETYHYAPDEALALTPYQARALLMGAEKYDKALKRRRMSPRMRELFIRAGGTF